MEAPSQAKLATALKGLVTNPGSEARALVSKLGVDEEKLAQLLHLGELPCRADGTDSTRGTLLTNDLVFDLSASAVLIGPSGSGKSSVMKVCC